MAPTGGAFDRKGEVLERLHQGPGTAAQQEVAVRPEGPTPSRWTLRTIRVTFPWLPGYTLSGVWRILDRYELCLRSGRVQLYSPDPDYGPKVAHLSACLQAAALAPDAIVFLFMDEMGYYRWPDPAADWAPVAPAPAPVARRGARTTGSGALLGHSMP